MKSLGFAGILAVIAAGCGSFLPTEGDGSGKLSAGTGHIVFSAQAGVGSCGDCSSLTDDELSYETPNGLRIGVLSVELLRAADDASPVVLSVPADLGVVDLVEGATISDADITAIPEGEYTHARVALGHVVFETNATGHLAGLISAEGELTADYALSDHDDDELGPRVQGDYAASFSAFGVSISQSGWEAVDYPAPHPGGWVDTTGGIYRVTFPAPGGSISISHDAAEDVLVALTFFIEDALGWRDLEGAGFLDDVLDVTSDADTEMPESMVLRGFSMDVTTAPVAVTYDACGGLQCGDTCTLCQPDDADCVETMIIKVCNASGVCSSQNTQCGG